ncbi:hypothetical protein [Epilithonimonas tenax]|uniref:hypothetical protein n=1 Tax=Epilithonimonas tenax TaxID=191577 RepID=UPI0012B630F6|nr:hypothetical protein [Epilithonimonas tenax]
MRSFLEQDVGVSVPTFVPAVRYIFYVIANDIWSSIALCYTIAITKKDAATIGAMLRFCYSFQGYKSA